MTRRKKETKVLSAEEYEAVTKRAFRLIIVAAVVAALSGLVVTAGAVWKLLLLL